MTPAERVLKALMKKPGVLWDLHLRLQGIPLAGPWEQKPEGKAYRAYPNNGMAALVWLEEGEWGFKSYFSNQPREHLQGKHQDIFHAMRIVDTALKEDGVLLVGGLPSIADRWVQIHEGEWRRLDLSADQDFKRACDVTANGAGGYTASVLGKDIPSQSSSLREACLIADTILEKEGWWLLDKW